MSFDIEKLYKENSEKTGPDMDKLWGRIEAGLDEQEKADTKTKPAIAHTRSRGLMRYIAVAACAVIAVTGAFIMLNRESGTLKTDKTNRDSSYSQKSGEAAEKNSDGINKSAAAQNEAQEKAYDGSDAAEPSEDRAEEDNTANMQSLDADIGEAEENGVRSPAEQNTSEETRTAAADNTNKAGSSGDNNSSTTQDPETEPMEPKEAQKAVDDAIAELVNSDEYTDADAGRKAELAEEVFEKLCEQGAVISYTIETDPLIARYRTAGILEGIVSLG